MHHNCTHEYSINAFRVYSLCGCPKRDDLLEFDMHDPSIEDLEAVSLTLEQISMETDGKDTIDCIKEVYLKRPEEIDSKGEITLRVRKASYCFAMSESTVYRHLSKACRMFAKNRGLRDPNDEQWLLNLFRN